MTFDSSPQSGTPGALLGFVGGDEARAFTRLPADERRRAALGSFARAFGPQALIPIDYFETDWAAEPFTARLPGRDRAARAADDVRPRAARARRAAALGGHGVRDVLERLHGRRGAVRASARRARRSRRCSAARRRSAGPSRDRRRCRTLAAMLPTDHLLAFALLAFVLILVPGPSVLFVVTRSLTLGRGAGVATVVGNATGAYVQVDRGRAGARHARAGVDRRLHGHQALRRGVPRVSRRAGVSPPALARRGARMPRSSRRSCGGSSPTGSSSAS